MSKSFCIDIGGTAIKSGFVVSNKIKEYSEVKTPKNKSEFLESLVSIIKNNVKYDDKICISIASPIISGIVQSPPNLPINNFDIVHFLKKQFKNKIYLENDARCAALAENKINKRDNFVLLTLGTGIGGAVFISGKLYKGTGYAGELGHIMIGKKYLETLWKTKNKTVEYISEALVSVQNSIDPELIIISTRVIQDKSNFLKLLNRKLNSNEFNANKPKIIFSKIKNPELIGASILPKLK